MHLMYVDESGDDGFDLSRTYPRGKTPLRFFLRVSLILHDRKWHKIVADIENFRAKWKIPMSVELHATEILSGTDKKRRYNWYGKNYPIKSDRINILLDACRLLASLDITMICVAIDKSKINTSIPNYRELPKNNSWEYLIERMNLFLEYAPDKKGMIISDAIEDQIEASNRLFARALYAQSTHISAFHFIESILFEPSDSSLMLQMADVAAFACHRYYNMGDRSFYSIIEPRLFIRSGEISPDGAGLKIWP